MGKIGLQRIQDPIIILGAARSGTKILRDTIANHPLITAIPYDINFVWKYGQYKIDHDELDSGDLTENNDRFIHSFFDRFQLKHPNTRIIEKTVSNTVRVDFVHKVFPNCQFIHLIRDGRDVSASSMIQWQAPLNHKEIFHKLKLFPLKALPNYALKYILSYFFRSIFHKNHISSWGVRLRDLDELLNNYSLLEVCGIQWDRCVNSTLDSLNDISGDRKIEVRYEALTEDPIREIKRIMNFLNLDTSEEFLSQIANKIKGSHVNKWEKSVNSEELEKLMFHIYNTIKKLDYLDSDLNRVQLFDDRNMARTF